MKENQCLFFFQFERQFDSSKQLGERRRQMLATTMLATTLFATTVFATAMLIRDQQKKKKIMLHWVIIPEPFTPFMLHFLLWTP